MKNKILVVVIAVAVLASAISGAVIVHNHLVASKADQELEVIGEQTADKVEPTEESNPVETISPETIQPTPSPTPEAPALMENPYADSFLANTDMAAWIKIEDTKIDYPVMQTPEDENFYLYLNFDKNKDNNGSLILDTDSSIDPIGTNLIIHGHNMKSGAMFGELTEYKEQTYEQAHNLISLYTKECERRYEVIAVFYSQVYRKSDDVFKFYQFFQADTEEEFNDYYDNIKELSLYDTGVTASFGDRFLTLSTCSYQVENGRFVVVAKEIEAGDSYLPIE